MRSMFLVLLAVVGGTKAASAQAAPIRVKLRIPSNVAVQAYAPDSGRFSLEGAEPVARGDTLVLKNGAELSYDRSSGPIHFLVRGLKDGQTVDLTASGDNNSRWAAFVTHDVAIIGHGLSLQTMSIVAPVVALVERNR